MINADSTSARRCSFTLIELLVVVAIILVLLAMLLPALSRAKYQAKLTICISNLKQVGTGVLLSAADDDTYYPVRNLGRHPLTQYDSHFRKEMEPYMGDHGLQVFSCPVAPVQSTTATNYQMFFNCKAANSQGWNIGINDASYRVVHYNAAGNPLSDGCGSCTQCTWYYYPDKGRMIKVGQSWTQRSTGKKFKLLLSDTAIHYGGHPGYHRTVNHHDFTPGFSLAGDYWYTKPYWSTPRYSRVYPKMSGHFAGDDMSIQRISIPAGSAGSDFTSIGSQIVPLEFEVPQ